MGGTIYLDDVFRMLETCAPGHSKRLTDHYWIIKYNDLEYTTLPTGAKSDKKKEVQIFKVAKMIRVLRIDRVCARAVLPALRGLLKDVPELPC